MTEPEPLESLEALDGYALVAYVHRVNAEIRHGLEEVADE